MNKLLRSTLAVGAIVGTVQLVSAVPAAAAGCGTARNTSTSGAQAYWQISCKRGNISVSGWVKDTDTDGQCAQVKARFPGAIWEFSQNACPKNNKKDFSWTHPGDMADIYLFEHSV